MNSKDFMEQMDQAAAMMRNAYLTLATQLERCNLAGQVLAIDEAAVTHDDLQLDLAITQAVPLVAAPRVCPFHPLQDSGHRFVMAANGLHLEVRRPWIHFLHCLAPVADVAVPYGTVEPVLDLAFGRVGRAIPQLQEFARHAAAAGGIETAAAVIWNSSTDEWRIEYPPVITASATGIQFEQPILLKNEHLVIDLHSHGHGPAFFSATDDADDAGSVKIAGVFGYQDGVPSVAFRICVLGITIPLNVPADKIFAW